MLAPVLVYRMGRERERDSVRVCICIYLQCMIWYAAGVSLLRL